MTLPVPSTSLIPSTAGPGVPVPLGLGGPELIPLAESIGVTDTSTRLASLAASLVSVVADTRHEPDATLPAGHAVTLGVVAPQSVPLTAAGVGTVPVVTETRWTLVKDDLELPGHCFQVIEGDLATAGAVVAFHPGLSGMVSAVARVTVTAAGASVRLPPVTMSFTLAALDVSPRNDGSPAPALQELSRSISALARLVVPAQPLPPGAASTVSLVAETVREAPKGVVTSLTVDTPSVELRGAIPVGVLLKAAVSMVTSLAGQSTASKSVGSVLDLLGDQPAIPLALDVQGERVVRELTPDPTAVVGQVRDMVNHIAGTVAINSWLEPAYIVGLRVDRWCPAAGESAPPLRPDDPPNGGLTQVLNPLAFDIPANGYELRSGLPKTYLVRATLSAVIFGQRIQVTLPEVPLLQLPLPLPRLAVTWKNSFDDDRDDAQIVTDHETYLMFGGDLQALRAHLAAVLEMTKGIPSELLVALNGSGPAWEGGRPPETGIGALRTALEQLTNVRIWWGTYGTVEGLSGAQLFEVGRYGSAWAHVGPDGTRLRAWSSNLDFGWWLGGHACRSGGGRWMPDLVGCVTVPGPPEDWDNCVDVLVFADTAVPSVNPC